MKFKSTWAKELQKLPHDLQTHCFNYKHWKKIAKQQNVNPDDILCQIEKQSKQINRIFLSNISKRSSKPILSCIHSSHVIPKDVMYNFAKLNSMCLYKLLKRFDKRLGTNMKSWLVKHRSEYAFCGGYQLKYLELELYGFHDECPICLDDSVCKLIILDCSHVVCINCFTELYKINNLNGTIHNLVAYSNYVNNPKCPMCRTAKPIKEFDKLHIYSSSNSK